MSAVSCTCDTPVFGKLSRPSCVIIQGVLYSPMLVPRYGSDGLRNTIDLAADPLTFLNPLGVAGDYATVGAYIKAKAEDSDFNALDRFYPSPKVETATFDRTDTVYDTAGSGRRVQLDGVGGVRTFAYEYWNKDAVQAMLREIQKYGCSDLDLYYIAVDGAMWGIKDDPKTYVIRGYEMDTATFDSYLMYATDTTTNKLSVSFDLDQQECDKNAYAITAEELGYKATTLKSPIAAFSIVSNPTTTTILMVPYQNFGTASISGILTGLLDAAFVITSAESGVLAHATPLVETEDGYTITMDVALVSTETITIETTALGYEVENAVFVVA